MLTIYDSQHIPTSRHLQGHRACRTQTGIFTGPGEVRRVHYEHLALVNRRLRLAWLVRQWNEHKARCGFMKEQYA